MKLAHIPAKPAKLVISTVLSTLLFGASAFGQSFAFGTNNDGDDGFTPSAESGTEAWTVAADSYNYAFGTPGTGDTTNDEGNTASLLRSFTLDKSAGSEYSINGVLDLTNGYGDDNNRIGILLFNDTAAQTSDGGGGLYLRVNTDDGNTVAITDGINGTALDSVNHSYNPGDQWIGQTLNFSADLTFKNDGVADRFDVALTLTDGNGIEYNLSVSDLLTADYTGTYFGFASKWRYRDQSSSARDVPAEFDYQSFSVTRTDIPEPSAYALLAGLLGLSWVMVRRCA